MSPFKKRDSAGNTNPRGDHCAAQTLFFPAAAVHAAIVLPLSVHALTGGQTWLPGLANRSAHAHEMLFGFALAVVAGFLISRTTRTKLWLLFGLWLVARLSFWLVPQTLFTQLANIAFAVCFALMAAPQFFTAAKKWRNQIFAPTVVALSIALTGFHLAEAKSALVVQALVLQETVILLALLMAFMGGRIIAPAVAGYLQTLGQKLEARVQPKIEAALLICLLLALTTAMFPEVRTLTGLLMLLAACVAGIRLIRWRFWLCRKRPDLICLGIGYLWLVVGMGLLGASFVSVPNTTALNTTVALHAITVGALGTLTLTVMARKHAIRAHEHPASIRGLLPACGMIAIATFVRLVWPYSSTALMGAASLWSAAFLLLLVMLLDTNVLKRRL
jgi:uncharacterized protein involved in response to NO